MTNAGVHKGIVVLLISFFFFGPFSFFCFFLFTVYLYNFTSLHYKHFLILYKLVYRVKDEHLDWIILLAPLTQAQPGIYRCSSNADHTH